MEEVTVGRLLPGPAVTPPMIVLFIVLSRNKLRIPLEGTYSSTIVEVTVGRLLLVPAAGRANKRRRRRRKVYSKQTQ